MRAYLVYTLVFKSCWYCRREGIGNILTRELKNICEDCKANSIEQFPHKLY